MRNMLLPRSTGLYYCLRSLSPRIPGLHLLDVTISYEGKLKNMFPHPIEFCASVDSGVSGIPPQAYGQSYYTLRSIFMDGVPPPRIHMHLRLYDVSRDVPLGNVSPGSTHTRTPNGSPISVDAAQSQSVREKEMDLASKEAVAFEHWLRNLWREKDALIDRFLATGSFAERPKAIARDSGVSVDHHTDSMDIPPKLGVEVPVELRSKWEIPDAFALFAPVLAWAVWCKTLG